MFRRMNLLITSKISDLERGQYIIDAYINRVMVKDIAIDVGYTIQQLYAYLKICNIRRCNKCGQFKTYNDFFKNKTSN